MTEISDAVYEARYGPNRRDLFLLSAAVLFAAFGIYIVSQGYPAFGWFVTALFSLLVVFRIVQWTSRRVAFRVDATGVTLGIAPPWPASRIASVPWSDLQRIVLWRQPANRTTVPYIGVDRGEQAPPLPGSARSTFLRKLNASAAPSHVPTHVVADSRPVNGWQLDRERLAAAVSRFAPHIEVVDLG